MSTDFLTRLRLTEGRATSRPWRMNRDYLERCSDEMAIATGCGVGWKTAWHEGDSELILLLVNNTEKIAALVEAAGKLEALSYVSYGDSTQHDATVSLASLTAVRDALTALDGPNDG